MSSSAPTLAEIYALSNSLLYQPGEPTPTDNPPGPGGVNYAGVGYVSIGPNLPDYTNPSSGISSYVTTDPVVTGLAQDGLLKQTNVKTNQYSVATSGFFDALVSKNTSYPNATTSIFNLLQALGGYVSSQATSTNIAFGALTSGNTSNNLSIMQNSQAFNAFLTTYANIVLGIQGTESQVGSSIINNTNTNLGDLSSLSGLLSNFQMSSTLFDSSVTGSSLSSTNQFILQNFVETFNQFLGQYNFANGSSGSGSLGNLSNAWYQFLSFQASLSTPTTSASSNAGALPDIGGGEWTPIGSNPPGPSTNAGTFVNFGSNLTTYQNLYMAFVPGATQAGFQATLQNFYNQQIKQFGYFVPTQSLSAWLTTIQNTTQKNPPTPSSVAGNDGSKLTAIFSILDLLANMTGTLQNVAIRQANRLTVYSNIQEAYTNLISLVPQITEDQIKPYVNDTSTNVNTLASTITTLNSNYTEQLKDYRTLFSDEAQQEQTAVNQTNQAVNQQSDLFTSLIQEMSTVLQSIFHG